MPGNPFQGEAELEVLARAVRHLGWSAVDGDAQGQRSFGWDVKLHVPNRSVALRPRSEPG
jgi:hypothetical protein